MWDNPKPLDFRKEIYMKELLFFILGLVIGGLSGVTVLCCMQINRLNDNYEKTKYEKTVLDKSSRS